MNIVWVVTLDSGHRGVVIDHLEGLIGKKVTITVNVGDLGEVEVVEGFVTKIDY